MLKENIKFDVAYNFEEGLIEGLGKLGNVHSVYAKLNSDIIGGGRPSVALPDVSLNTLKSHIERVHSKGIKFNYLLNSVCLSNRELQKEEYQKIVKYLGQICDLNVDSVTVANPFLCDLIKKQFPSLEVCLSVNVRVHTLQQIKYWEDFGIDEITLDQIVNRNFDLLKKILLHTKHSNTRIRLFTNNICLHDCPMRTYHGLSNSHASQSDNQLQTHLHYYYYKCTEMKFRDPSKLISATWIRPDDLHYYEDIMEQTGNNNLVFKLVERASTNEYLLRTLQAYQNKKYDGNLMDIIYAIQSKYMLSAPNKKMEASYRIESLQKLKLLFDMDWFYIDNRKLDGFLDHFVNNYNCDKSICASKAESEESCLYCHKWAQKAISYDKEKQNIFVNNLSSFISDMQMGEIFI